MAWLVLSFRTFRETKIAGLARDRNNFASFLPNQLPGFFSGNGSCKEHVIPTGQLLLLPYVTAQMTKPSRVIYFFCIFSLVWRREGSSFIFNPRSWKNKSPGGKEGVF
jgi:hypothetical protein